MIPALGAQSGPENSLAAPAPTSLSLTWQDTLKLSPYSAIIASVFDGAPDAAGRMVLLVSVEARAGVTRTASTIAGELAASGRKVLLVDATAIASFPPEAPAVSLCERAGADHIWVLGSAQTRRSKLDFSQFNPRPASVLQALSREFPCIVLDAPALAHSNVALRLAAAVETILVVRAGHTQARAAVKACGKIAAAGGRLLGCVYNDDRSRGQGGKLHEI